MNHRPKLKTQLDAVLYFFSAMDIDMISTLLSDRTTYQDYSKDLFIKKLDLLMFEFSELGDSQLLIEKGACYGCSCGLSGYTFIGNTSRSFIDLVFVVDNHGIINDIYECAEFFNKRSKYKKKNRLYLEENMVFDLNDGEDGYWDDDGQSFDDDDIPF